jgi:hypothetical protein
MGRTCSTHEKMRKAYKFLVGNMKARDNLGCLGVNERIIIKWIFKK